MVVALDRARPEELPAIVAALDREFIYAKQRSISLATRFPHVFADTATIIVARAEEGVVATAAARPFSWLTGDRTWRGAMVGMVWTHPQWRGQGLASQVMRALTSQLREQGTEFAVLWTGIAGFYARLGLQLHDRSVFGVARLTPQSTRVAPASIPLEAGLIPEIEAIRRHWRGDRVLRAPADYGALPIPAAAVDCYLRGDCYALVGRTPSGDAVAGYIYEVVGNPTVFSSLWEAIAASYSAPGSLLYVNDREDSAFAQWLSDRGFITWEKQAKTMWLGFTEEANITLSVGWHIPFFDRI